MSRLSSLLIVAAVAAVAIAAGVSALLSGGRGGGPGPVPTEDMPSGEGSTIAQGLEDELPAELEPVDELAALAHRDDLVLELVRAGLTGTLAIAKRGGCGVAMLSLPYLRVEERPGLRTCSFAAVDDGRLVPSWAARQPDGIFVATCENGRVLVFDQLLTRHPPPQRHQARRYSFAGCAPAWKPDGTLTFVRAGRVLALDPSCLGSRSSCGGLHVSTRLHERTLRSAEPALAVRSARFEQIAWLDSERFIAVFHVRLAGGSRQELVGLFANGKARSIARLKGGELTLLRVSPKRTYVAVRAAGTQAIWILRAQGEELAVRRFPPWAPPAPTDIRAIAWSSDERWTAVSSRRSIYLFRTRQGRPRYVHLPVAASDLLWR